MTAQKENRNIKWIYFVIFLDFFAVSLILPSMSVHLKRLGASYSMIGAMSSIYALSQLISGPIIGNWSDKIGRKKIFIGSCLIIGSCYATLGLIESLYIMLILRATIGLFKHSQVLIRAIIVDQVPEEKQPLVFGRLKSVVGISFSLGPIIGGHLTELDGGFMYMALCTGILFFCNSAVAYYYFEEPVSLTKENTISGRKNRGFFSGTIDAIRDLSNMNWLIFGDVFVLKFISSLASVAYFSNYSGRIQERFDISPKISGYTIAFQSCVGVVTGLFISSINNKFYKDDVSYRKRNLHSFVMMTAAFLGSYFARDLSFFLISSMIFQISHMLLKVSLTNLVIKRSPASQQGSVAGFDQSVLSIARMISPLTIGVIEDTFGSNSGLLLSAMTSLFGVFITARLSQSHLKSS